MNNIQSNIDKSLDSFKIFSPTSIDDEGTSNEQNIFIKSNSGIKGQKDLNSIGIDFNGIELKFKKINLKFYSINILDDYNCYSFEELRLNDYNQLNKNIPTLKNNSIFCDKININNGFFKVENKEEESLGRSSSDNKDFFLLDNNIERSKNNKSEKDNINNLQNDYLFEHNNNHKRLDIIESFNNTKEKEEFLENNYNSLNNENKIDTLSNNSLFNNNNEERSLFDKRKEDCGNKLLNKEQDNSLFDKIIENTELLDNKKDLT